jgi:hypothetical protein
MEPEIKEQIDPEVYRRHLELMEIALDVNAITEGLNRVREKNNAAPSSTNEPKGPFERR